MEGAKFPALMIIGSMIGFGSLARDSGMTLPMAVISTVGIWGLPGQMAMAEMFALGAPLAAIVIASSMANLRFMPMALSIVPLFRADPRGWAWRYVLTQIMSINVWAIFMLRVPTLPAEDRFPYFVGVAISCLTAGVTGTVTGFVLAGVLPTYVSVSLIFLNLSYFIFVFCSTDQRNCIFAVVIGSALGPLVYTVSPDWGLPFCGLAAGTAAFYLDLALGGKRGRA
jgi:predicted branched-subunit amino acid permease